MNSVGSITAELPLARAWARARALSLAEPAGEAAAIFLLCPVLLAIAFWNGFPLIFYDTGAYVLEGLGHVFVPERAPVYSLLLLYTGAAASLWFVAWLQALLTSIVMVETARAESAGLPVWQLVAMGIALCLLTSLGWYVGQIEPDCLAAVAALALYLLAFRRDTLGTARSVGIAAIAALATAVHPSNLALAAGLVLCIALFRGAVAFAKSIKLPRPRLTFPATSIAVAIGLVFASNYALTGQYFITKTGAMFEFARMLQDGLVTRVLDDTCPQAHYRMCAFKDHLPNRADAFLWDADSPFNKLNRFHGPIDEYRQIVAASLARYPVANSVAAFRDMALQFGKIRTGDQIEPQEWVIYSDLAHYLPRQMNAYMSARQQQGELRFIWLNVIHVAVAIASMLALFVLLWTSARRRDWQASVLPAFVFTTLLGNAFVCGVFSNPHDRYQSRLVWVPCFVLLVLFSDRILANLNRIRHLMRDG